MSGDNAIRSSDEDRLGRSGFADHLAAALLGEDAGQGLVAALVGPWGQGKSSVLNMVKERLSARSRTVLIFNPWMFSGRDQLVGAFFEQVGGQLRLRGGAERALADRLISYGQALSPLVFVPVAGTWLARAGAVATAIGTARSARKRPDPVEQQRQAIEVALGKLAEPIFVFIDDIDRLTAPEIRDMLGLVRLTAHFPRIIYLLAFDRAKVEGALDQDGLDDGRSYLDKIVELSFDLPATSRPAIGDLLIEGLNRAAAGVETGPLDRGRSADVMARVLLPLLSTPRDVNRYLAALPAGLRMIGDEVALADVLALEAVRLRLPDVFALLGPLSHALTDVGMITSRTPGWQEEISAFIRAAGDHSAVASQLCRLLFPATERYLDGSNTVYPRSSLALWRKQRRVASPEVLGIYLSKQLSPGALPAAAVELAVTSMADKTLFQVVVDSMSASDLDDLLARLTGYEDDIPPSAVQPACAVLLGLYSRLRTWSKGIFDLGPERAVDRVVGQLLRGIDDVAERTRIIEALCAGVTGFTGRIRLLHMAGRTPNPEMDRLIPAADSDRLYQQICGEIRHASAAQITAERDPLRLLAVALAEDPADRKDVDCLLEDDTAAAALLLSASAQIRGQASGSVAVHAEQVLRWQLLGTVAGDDNAIAALTDRVAAQRADEEAVAVITLARQYLDGWRPSRVLAIGQDPVIRQALNTPNMIFSPLGPGGGWPALLIRAVTTYEVDPAWAARADVSGAEFHDHLCGLLAATPMAGKIAELAHVRGLPDDASDWDPDPDAYQSGGAAVRRLRLGSADRPTAALRYAVFLPDQAGPGHTGPMKLFTDIMLSPGEDTDVEWGQLSLEEIRDSLAAALDASAGALASQLVTSICAGETPPRTAVELYLWSAQGQGGRRPSNTLNTTIALDSLGPPTRPDQPAAQGMFAVAGDTPTFTARDRRILIVHALIRMALDWGYLDARARLLPLASA